MRARLFELRRAEHPWADYGDILVHGMSSRLPRHNGLLQLERTGPFVPPLSFPGIEDIILTDDARRAFLDAGFTGADFRVVQKARIVRLDWDSWDPNTDEPAAYPDHGEPEGYILDRPHDAALAESMGDLWELVPTVVQGLRVRGGGVISEKHPGVDVCIAGEFARAPVVSSRLREWLQERYPQWIRLNAVRSPDAA